MNHSIHQNMLLQNKLRGKKMNKKLIVLLISMTSASVLAKLPVTTIKNTSKKNIYVTGYGLGCAGVVLNKALACGVKPIIIKPGKSAQVKYNKKVAATKGGIRLLAIENGTMYQANVQKKIPQKITFSTKNPGVFKSFANFKKTYDQALPKLAKTRQTKEYYFVAFGLNKNGKLVEIAEGPMPMDGTLKIGIDKNYVPMVQIDQYQSSDAKGNKDTYKVILRTKNFKK